jgi:hypothetical protein
MATQMLDNLAGAWERFTGAIDDKMISIGQTLAGFITPILNKIAEIIDSTSPTIVIIGTAIA